MGEIMIKCPKTGDAISTGIHCDRANFLQVPLFVSYANCQICGDQHSWTKADAWLSDELMSEKLPTDG